MYNKCLRIIALRGIMCLGEKQGKVVLSNVPFQFSILLEVCSEQATVER